MTANEYLATLTDKSAWVFTKQDTSFEESFKATKLFATVCYTPDINIEQYFATHHNEYDINTDRHRMLVIPQLYGLITKTPFYGRGSQYNKERPTEIFDLIKNEEIGSKLYNKIKTEQILKLKIHSIIDTANNNENYAILPVIFIYKVLKELQIRHGITEISMGHFWTYIATCKSYIEVDQAVGYIAEGAPISEYVGVYSGNSRILTIIRNNIALFNVDARTLSINPDFDEYFNNNFMQTHDIDELHEQLLRDVDYSYLLYNHQEFDINLIDIPVAGELLVRPTPFIEELDEDAAEKDYLEKVDAIKEDNVNDDISIGAYDTEPIISVKKGGRGRVFKINPILGKIAITRAYYTCEHNHDHITFESNRTHKLYMEAHHLVPVANQREIWEKFGKNVDCVENLVSLCPNCHKAFHYGTKTVKSSMIDSLFDKIVHKYRAIGFNITKDEVKQLYGIDDKSE